MASSSIPTNAAKEPLLDTVDGSNLATKTPGWPFGSRSTSSTKAMASNGSPRAAKLTVSESVKSRLLKIGKDDARPFLPALKALSLYLGLGFLVFWLLNNETTGIHTNSVVDSLYFTVVTLTTVGYGGCQPLPFFL